MIGHTDMSSRSRTPTSLLPPAAPQSHASTMHLPVFPFVPRPSRMLASDTDRTASKPMISPAYPIVWRLTSHASLVSRPMSRVPDHTIRVPASSPVRTRLTTHACLSSRMPTHCFYIMPCRNSGTVPRALPTWQALQLSNHIGIAINLFLKINYLAMLIPKIRVSETKSGLKPKLKT